MVTTTMNTWRVLPDIIGDGEAEQEEIMTTICETKGATFDGTDCVGDLDDTSVYVSLAGAILVAPENWSDGYMRQRRCPVC